MTGRIHLQRANSIRTFGVILVGLGLTTGCGGKAEVGHDGSTGGTAGNNTGGSNAQAGAAGSQAPSQSGDCTLGSAADACPDGSECVEMVPGGFRVCANKPPEATTCHHPMDECCESADCTQGACYSKHLAPVFESCEFGTYNVCAVDACQEDRDCPEHAVCVPAGIFGKAIRRCLPASCRTDSDCTAQKGGICAPVQAACCNDFAALLCVYPENGCRSHKDCPEDRACKADGKNGVGICSDPIPCPFPQGSR